MVTADNYTIRTMTRQDVDIAIDWAAEEGWNPGLHDGDSFYAADPTGFLVGLVDDEPVASISVVKYGDSFGFLGLYIVKKAYRGMGYGLRLWHAGMGSLEGRTVGLDGVVAQQDNYRKSGFTLAYNNVRYQGMGGEYCPENPQVAPLATFPFEVVCGYDAQFFPDDRRQFLASWLIQPQSIALGIMENGRFAGYGVMRECRSGYKIGPLFADNDTLAEALFSALKSRVPVPAPVFLDVPATNFAAVALTKRHDMEPVFETARMYRGQAPDLPINRLFGVTTFELG